MKSFPLYMLLLMSLGLMACQKGEDMPNFVDEPYPLDLPNGFPQPDVPANNELTVARVALGKKLFYDKRLSRDSSISCASCHIQSAAFADHEPISIGIEGRVGFRNSPTLVNMAYHPYFFMEGGSPSLEMQVIGPLENPDEMDISPIEVVARLQEDTEYAEMAQQAYDRVFDIFVLTRALAAFERTLISGNSAYDQYMQGDSSALSASQKRGMQLFFSDKTDCSQCHSGFNFTEYSFENIGLYEEYEDLGLARKTTLAEDVGKFKVPTLRNIAQSYPYMHDGSISSLAEVIEHFNQGGTNHPNKSPLIRPLALSAQEKADLVAFLESLSDEAFLRNQDFGE